MALSDRAYVRVPPDGAGKALMSGNIRHLEYTAAVGLDAFVTGDRVTGAQSGLSGVVLHTVPESATTGAIGVSVDFGDLDKSFTDSEDLWVGGVTRARLDLQEDVFVSKTQVVGANNPQHGQSVDNKGAASIRFAEGSIQFDSFGRTEVSERTWIGNYALSYDDLPRLFDTTLVGGGGSVYHAPSSSVVLSTASANGDAAYRRSHLYHKYISGISQVIQMAVSIGDQGKTNVRRRWGYFDDRNGAFFELDGEDLYVVLRSDVTGTVVDTRVPQSEWNGDRLDGSVTLNNRSGAEIDLSMMYLYGIDVQWYGAGPVRFFTNVTGTRIVLHTMLNAGTSNTPYMGTATLPIQWTQENTGVAASTSEMRIGSSSVACEGLWNPPETQFASWAFTHELAGSEVVAFVHSRARETFQGQDNRTVGFGRSVTVVSMTEPVLLRVICGGTFTNIDTWDSADGSALEYGFNAGGAKIGYNEDGKIVYSQVFAPGEAGKVDMNDAFSIKADSAIRRKYDITEEPEAFTYVITNLGSTASDVHLTPVFTEVH